MSQDDGEKNLWTKLEDLIDQICSFQRIQKTIFMNIHTELYNYMVGAPQRNTVVARNAPVRVRHLQNPRDVLGADVYEHIKLCLNDKLEFIVQSVKDMTNEDILRLYEKHWNQYKTMCDKLSGSCNYLNLHWVGRQRNLGRNIDEVDTMSQRIWERIFFQPLLPCIISVCCNMIKSQRNHQTIDMELLKSILQIFVNPDFNKLMAKISDKNWIISNIYKEMFEPEILQDTKEFYRHKTIPYDKEKSIITYLNQGARYIDEETDHVQSYLLESTKQSLIKIVEEIFIHDYRHVIDHEIKASLENNKIQDLVDLFKPISRMPNTKASFSKIIENYIQRMAIDDLKHVHENAIKDPKIYIDTIHNIYINYLKFIEENFNSDPELISSLNNACQKFINNNPITESTGSTRITSKLLVQYCDRLLRKDGKTLDEKQFEEKCDQILLIFNFIEDKDIYERIYGKSLEKRLINQLSISDDYEKLIITKFKQLCGNQYTSKLEKMVHDIEISQIINQNYRIYCENQQDKLSVDFSIMILTTNSWSISIPSNIILPTELNRLFNNFIQFYNQTHTGRKLTCLYEYSKGELQTYFTQQHYILQVSMYQMIVLLLFNKSLKWTVEQIQNETEIKIDLLIQILDSLIKSNLLFCTQYNNENDFQMNSIIELTNEYKNKNIRVDLKTLMKSTKEKDLNDLHKTIDEDRINTIQATIVRIMKKHQTLKYSLLIQKVIEQLNSRFKPNISMIKKCIEILIEKEYLQRQMNENDVLEYLA